MIFWDFTAKRVTLKWFNLHTLCKNLSKTTFLAYTAISLDLLWNICAMLKMISKKVDFDPILTQKRVILLPILRFMGQITQITPKMDSLTQKTYV